VGFCISTSSRKRKQIFVRQFVILLPKLREISGEFCSGEQAGRYRALDRYDL